MAWIDDHEADVLARFRARFDDMEWQLFCRGDCCWQVEYGTGRNAFCGKSRQGRYIYCLSHVREVSASVSLVPASVAALGTELPD